MRINSEYLHPGKLLPNHSAELGGLKVWEQRIQEKNLAEEFVQALKCLGATGSFGQIPAGLTKLLPQLKTKPAVRADEQNADSIPLIYTRLREVRGAHKFFSALKDAPTIQLEY
jgi:hypothetical protein